MSDELDLSRCFRPVARNRTFPATVLISKGKLHKKLVMIPEALFYFRIQRQTLPVASLALQAKIRTLFSGRRF